MEDVSLDLKKNAPKSTRRTHGGRGKRGRRRFGAGRKKGVPNKLKADVKAAVMEAFIDVGGAAYLRKLARSDPRTFCTLLGKVLLEEVEGEPDEPVLPNRVEFVIVRPNEQPPRPKPVQMAKPPLTDAAG
jgi:hypothetical protein